MRKMLAMLLAMLMLALPVSGMAEADFITQATENGRMVESSTTFTMASTGDETADGIISELLAALSINTYWQEGDAPQGGLRVNMSGTDILSIDGAAANNLFYLRSDLLAGTTVAFGQDDVQPITEKLANTLVAMGMITEDNAAEMLSAMTEAAAGASNPLADVDFEAIVAGFDATTVEAIITDMSERVEQADLAGLPEGSDPAIMALTITLTGEDMVKLCDAVFDALKGNAEYMALLDSMLTVEDVNMDAGQLIDEMKTQVDAILPEAMAEGIPVTVYLNGDDEVVAATCQTAMKATMNDGEEPENVKVDFTYSRHTAEAQVSHSVVYVIEGESAAVTMTADVETMDNGDLNAAVTFKDEDTEITFAIQQARQETETEQKTGTVVAILVNEAGEQTVIQLTVDTDAKKTGDDVEKTTAVKFSLDGNELFTATTVSKTADPVESIANADALRLAELSQEDFQGWFQTVLGNLQVWLMTALQSLPSSVLMMFVGQ